MFADGSPTTHGGREKFVHGRGRYRGRDGEAPEGVAIFALLVPMETRGRWVRKMVWRFCRLATPVEWGLLSNSAVMVRNMDDRIGEVDAEVYPHEFSIT